MQTCVCVRQGIPLNPSGLSPAPCSCMASKGAAMASFHLAVKTIGRSAGRSATAAAAYRAGVEITDERTGLVHDYTRKQGVEHSELMLPTDAPEWAADRERLWNAAELAETRKNATVAREYEIALPVELSADERRELALGLARAISERPGGGGEMGGGWGRRARRGGRASGSGDGARRSGRSRSRTRRWRGNMKWRCPSSGRPTGAGSWPWASRGKSASGMGWRWTCRSMHLVARATSAITMPTC